MSNINNQTQDFYSIKAVQDLSHEAAAAIQGGAAIEFFEDVNFGKTTSGLVTNDLPYIGDLPYVGDFWNDRISSVKVYSGQWEFWTDANYSGRVLTLGPGEYASFAPNTNDVFSSIRAIR